MLHSEWSRDEVFHTWMTSTISGVVDFTQRNLVKSSPGEKGDEPFHFCSSLCCLWQMCPAVIHETMIVRASTIIIYPVIMIINYNYVSAVQRWQNDDHWFYHMIQKFIIYYCFKDVTVGSVIWPSLSWLTESNATWVCFKIRVLGGWPLPPTVGFITVKICVWIHNSPRSPAASPWLRSGWFGILWCGSPSAKGWH